MTFTSKTILFTLALVVIATVIYANLDPAFSVRELLGLESSGKPAVSQVKSEAEQDNQAAGGTAPGWAISTTLDFEEVQRILAVVEEEQRKSLLADEKSFATFIKNEAANKSVLAAALANKVDQNPRHQYIMQRAVENITREIYLKQLLATKIPKDFPSEEQIRKYYDQNKDKFKLEERVHVWQIYLPFKDANDQKERELTKKQAETIINDITKNTLDFAEAAERYSNPPAGKYSGGYMGLVKVSELKPEIRQPLMNLGTDKISAPLQTADGVHILKRGTTVPAQHLRYDEVKDQIKRLLAREMQAQLTLAIFKQASETYLIDISDKNIEEWRLKLRTDTETEKSPPAE